MSYRLITKATLKITSAAGATTERIVEARAYPAPKREAAGLISVDGNEVQYRRTGGKGRGAISNNYAYAPVKGESAFFLITEAEAAALVGGKAVLTTIVEAAKAPEAKPTEATTEPVATAEVAKVAKRIRGQKAEA